MEGDGVPLQEAERRLKISTHALTWRATRAEGTSYEHFVHNFYPRPHMEGDEVAGDVKLQHV